MPEMVPGQGFRILDMIHNLEAAYSKLSAAGQLEYTSLHDFRFPSEENQNRLLTIFRSNAYTTGDSNIGLFPRIARINHSCRPNCGNWWSSKNGHRVIYAARDIEEGEEITVSYIPLLMKGKDRQARLAQYGFTCDCAACQSTTSDKVRVKIADLLESLEQKLPPSPNRKATMNERLALKSLKLLEHVEEEQMTDYLARALHIAAVFSQRTGEGGKAREFTLRELETRQLAEHDSEDVLKSNAFLNSL
ncbi:hypothetical protein BJ875DRAFT_474513 [Amylocarpus encephaloides]|uniref:SET domain-containing protein n=1 Tax=Amylocarpus encephaloides TaxID=45428 RepID=A0A9P7Y9D1_9HELO|nr:hypothetical protein BJ875DRAFT_474513 [Amylocarpus encephaloides]